MNARMIVAAVAVAAPLAVAAPASAAPARVNVPVLVGSRAAGGAQVSVWRWTGDGHRTARADTTGERRGLRNVTLTYRCGRGGWRTVTARSAATVRLPDKGRCEVIGTARWGRVLWQPPQVRRTNTLTTR